MRALVVIAIVLVARSAGAYPHFQLSSGTVQCAQCHLSPNGGGLLTPWGHEEGADTIARGGNGDFLHGAVDLPEWLALGGDFRFAALANDTGSSEGTELAYFPMQADLATRVLKDNLTFAATVGFRGAVRSGEPDAPPSDPPAGNAEGPSLRSQIIVREIHGGYYDETESGPYVRIGRFAAPYGLRLHDHTTYVRRYLGYNLLEETLGLGAGYLSERAEVHGTAFVYDRLQGATRKEFGGALLAEVQKIDDVILGVSTRVSVAPDDLRVQAGLHGKIWIPAAKLLLQGELDGVHQRFDAGGARNQLVAYAGPVFVVTRGIYTSIAYEAFAEDLSVRSVLRQAINTWLAVFPRAHWEVMLSARGQRIGPNERAVVGMLQVHYTL